MAGCIQFVSMPATVLPGITRCPHGILLAAQADAWERLAIYGVLLLAVLAMIAAVALFVKRNYLGPAGDQGPTTSDLLSNFRELYSQGELSDEEYRTIKTKLTARFQNELKRNDQAAQDDSAKRAEAAAREGPRDGIPRTWGKNS